MISKEDESAVSLDKALKNEDRPEAEKIVDFVRDNYLYIDKVPDFEKKAKDFISKGNVSNEDIKKFIEAIKLKDDKFTFVLSDSDYDEFTKFETDTHVVATTPYPKTLYVRVEAFTQTVDTEFKEAISKVKNSEDTNLIIDLRDDGGGLGEQANNILDMLLPECTTSSIMDRKGKTEDFHSGASSTKFKKILVLVDGNTASSSELLTLGLKKNLDNVTVIGNTTFGKGVGQVTRESKTRKYMLMLVNFYWNVKDQNVLGKGIIPDIVVPNSSDKAYRDITEKLIK